MHMPRIKVPLILSLGLLFLSSCSAQDSYHAKLSDLNGTWVDGDIFPVLRTDIVRDLEQNPKLLAQIPDEKFNWGVGKEVLRGIYDHKYGWGIGKRLPNTTIEIDGEWIGLGIGSGVIVLTRQINSSTFEIGISRNWDILKKTYPDKVDFERAIHDKRNMFLTNWKFVDSDRVIIDDPSNSLSISGKLELYKLSGPEEVWGEYFLPAQKK